MNSNGSIKFTNLHVLIADDQSFIRTLVRGTLTRLGVRNIHAAANGEEALHVLRDRGGHINLIISDWNMAPIGGLDILRIVRRGALPGVPTDTCFILLTGHAKSSVVTAAANLDANAYLVKPVSAQRLTETIEKAIAKRWTAKPAHFYEAVQIEKAPDDSLALTTNASSWAQWITQGRKAILEEGAKFVKPANADLVLDSVPPSTEFKQIRRKSVDKVKAGAILAEDVSDADGAVLVAAGTALTNIILQRLAKLKDADGKKINLVVGRR